MLARGAHSGRRGQLALAMGLATLLAGALSCQQTVERASSTVPDESGLGQVLYLTYCQSCHGQEGRGGGPSGPFLRTPPPDLTQLWTRYGTPLDRDRLVEYIDGRSLTAVHGLREMPVWGEEFFKDAPPLAPDTVERSKDHLVEVLIRYLETLQTKRAL